MTWRPANAKQLLVPVVAAALALPVAPLAITATDDAAAGYASPSSQGVTFSGTDGTGEGMSLEQIRKDGGMKDLIKKGHTGAGIDIALIDSGIAKVPGLDGDDKVLYGPDLSSEALDPTTANVDTFGHGTHLAGIMAGNDGSDDGFQGMAPDSRVVSVKVAGASGETNITAIIAAIDWVVENRNRDGLNIRVLNLSFGLDGVPSNLDDPLSAAAERAWDAGIVVVAAAGNRGNDTDGLDAPAISPFVLAVGGVTSANGKKAEIPAWSSAGNGQRDPDVVAVGQSILGLRVPQSTIDQANPGAVVDGRFLKGSGTSQAAAITSGSVAALLSADPSLTPDQVKYLLVSQARDRLQGTKLDGAGVIDIKKSAKHIKHSDEAEPQNHRRSRGRGKSGKTEVVTTETEVVTSETEVVTSDAEVVTSDADVTSNGGTWSGGTWSGGTWSGGTWSGATWSGGTWSGATWSGGTWSGGTWSGGTWSAGDWSGADFNSSIWG